MKSDERDALGALIRRAMDSGRTNVGTAVESVKVLLGTARDTGQGLAELQKAILVEGQSLRDDAREDLERQRGRLTDLTTGLSDHGLRVEATGEASRRVGKISSLLEVIAADSRLLSVNAKVQAANDAADARSIQVIADAIRDLSVSLVNCANELAEASGEIKEAIPAFGAQVAAARKTATAAGDDLDKVLNRLDSHQAEVLCAVDGLFQQVIRSSELTTDNAYTALSSLQGLDEVGQLQNAALLRLGTGHHDDGMRVPDRLLEGRPRLVEEEGEDFHFFEEHR